MSEPTEVEITLETLRGFVRVGGVPSFERWIALPEEVRAALIDEAERIRVEQAVRIGTAAHGPEAAAEILADIDGGELKRRLSLARSAARILDSEKARQKPLAPAVAR